jgi:hypothetical protein
MNDGLDTASVVLDIRVKAPKPSLLRWIAQPFLAVGALLLLAFVLFLDDGEEDQPPD